MYAIVKVGGKQYRVEKGDSLLVDRMPDDAGARVTLEPLLLAAGGKDEPVFRGDDLSKVEVEATVTGHERGPKIHVLKFKPKRGYKRRQGHRSELTRLEIGEIKGPGAKPSKAKAKAEPKAAAPKAEKPKAKAEPKADATKADKPKAQKPKAEPEEPVKDQGDKLEQKPRSKPAAAGEDVDKPEKAEPVKDQGDKLADVQKTKASATRKPAPEEESDGS